MAPEAAASRFMSWTRLPQFQACVPAHNCTGGVNLSVDPVENTRHSEAAKRGAL